MSLHGPPGEEFGKTLPGAFAYVAVQALDAQGNILATSAPTRT
jgi:hypothetical protein